MMNRSVLRIALTLFLTLTVCLAFVLPARAQSSAGDGEDYPRLVRFETLGVEDGLSQGTVHAIVQDRQGFLWIGTQDGLNRYDGYAFETFRHDPENPSSLRSNVIHSLFEDRDGRLWIGTDEGLDRYEAETNSFLHFHDSPQEGEAIRESPVLAIAQDLDGKIWLGLEDGGLSLLDRRTNNFIHLYNDPINPNSISDNTVTDIIVRPDGTFWVGTRRGLNRYSPSTGQFTRFQYDPANLSTIGGNLINDLHVDPEGNLWIATEDGGMSRFLPVTETFVRYPVADMTAFSLNSNSVRSLAEDADGNLWIGTRRGIDRMDPQTETFEHYRSDPANPDSLANDAVLEMYFDRSGVLWAGTHGSGLSKYSPYANKFNVYQQRPGYPNSLSDNMVTALHEDSHGFLWVGTMNGGLNRINRQTGGVDVFRNIVTDIASLSSDDVRAVIEDQNGTIWVGTAGGGLNRYNPSVQGFYAFRNDPDNPRSLSDDYINVLYLDSQNNLWIGTASSGLALLDRLSGRFLTYQHDPENPSSISGNTVTSIWEDDEGFLWVGTTDGLNRMQPASRRFRHYNYDPRNPYGLSSNQILSIYQDSQGTLWVGTQLGGLNRLDWETHTFRHFTEQDGLANDTIYAMAEDAQGHLWLSTNFGLSRFHTEDETFRNYDLKDGLPSNEFNVGAVFRSESGEIFFGGPNGISAFLPAELPSNPNPPPVVVTGYKEFNQTRYHMLQDNQQIELPFSVNFISFEFVALDFNAPGKNQYAYMLEGFDKDWIPVGNRRYVNYTNLQGGDYTFRVRGSNNDGVWNEQGISLNLRVIPPFWQRWWFITLVGVTLGVIVWGGYYLRLKSVESLNRQLEQQVRDRTKEIERRQEVAEGLRDIINILNSNRSLQDSLDHIIRQVVRLMNARTAVMFESDEQGGCRIIAGSLENGLRSENAEIPAWIVERVLNGERLAVEDQSRYRRLHRITDEKANLDEDCALLAMPMSVGDSTNNGGLLLVFDTPQHFREEDLKTAHMFTDQAALAIANARLRAHAEELAVSAERSRLARDLHDAVTQTLFATSLISEVLPRIWERDPEEGRRRLLEVQELTRGALAEMRTLLMELRPSALLDTPLGELLHQLCDAFRGRARVPVLFEGDEEGQPLEPDAQVVFYRVAQEALNNAGRHARATQVEMRLCDDGRQVRLDIADNGVGFDTGVVKPDHFGLVIMRERAQAIGADWTVDSAPGQGTRVRLVWERNGSQASQTASPEQTAG